MKGLSAFHDIKNKSRLNLSHAFQASDPRTLTLTAVKILKQNPCCSHIFAALEKFHLISLIKNLLLYFLTRFIEDTCETKKWFEMMFGELNQRIRSNFQTPGVFPLPPLG